MDRKDYPVLRQITAATARATKKNLHTFIWFHASLLLAGAIIASLPFKHPLIFLLAALIFCGALTISIVLRSKQFEKTWYGARSVAETIKSLTWQYMMKAPPFEKGKSDQESNDLFLEQINNLLDKKYLEASFAEVTHESKQVTDKMKEIRAWTIQKRKENYIKYRINEQKGWYLTSAKHNKEQSRLWFIIHIIFQILAIVCMGLRIALPTWGYWPTNLFVVAAGIALTWMQTNRFSELASSYSFTAMAISSINDQMTNANSEEQFTNLVLITENTFSKEHKQWVGK